MRRIDPRVAGVALVAALIACAVLTVGLGSVRVPPSDVVAVIARRMHITEGEHVTPALDRIVWQLRLPRVFAAVSVGAALATCGVVLQALTRNDLADPYLLGISSGAAVGACLAIVFGLTLPLLPPEFAVTGLSFAGALISLVAVLGLAAGPRGELPAARTILAGVAIAQVAGAITSMVVLVYGDRGGAQAVLMWMMGSLAGARVTNSAILAAVAIAIVLAIAAAARILDAFTFGDTAARALGVRTERTRWVMLTGCALVTAATVAVVGPIGFIGLATPHLVRLAVGPGHRTLVPLSAAAGGLLLLLSDTFARTVSPGSEIPIGVVTAFFGAPVLVVLLRRQGRRS